MVVNTHGNDKLSGFHVVHLVINDVVISKSVHTWIATDPVSLYKALMNNGVRAVTLPQKTSYSLSLHHAVYNKLKSKVKQVSPGLVFQTTCRKVSREVVR